MVDLPIPGSPPTRTIDPGTMPPPRTKSNSARPVFHRGSAAPTTLPSLRGVATCPPSPRERAPANLRAAPLPPPGDGVRATGSSTSVFHSPQTSHLPAHRGWSAPQLVQRYIVLAFGVTPESDALSSSRSG